MIIRHPFLVLYGALIWYGAGLAWWIFCSFFRSDHFTWPGVLRGFTWPWLWLRKRSHTR